MDQTNVEATTCMMVSSYDSGGKKHNKHKVQLGDAWVSVKFYIRRKNGCDYNTFSKYRYPNSN